MDVLRDNLKILKALGVYQPQNEPRDWPTTIKYNFIKFGILVNFYSAIIGGPMFAYLNSRDISLVIEVINNVLALTLVNTVILIILCQNDELHNMVDAMRDMYTVHLTSSEEANKIVQLTTKLCRFVTITFPFAAIASFCIVFCSTVLYLAHQRQEEIEKRYTVWFPIDVYSPYVFEIAVVYILAYNSYLVANYIAIASLITAILLHIVAQLQILNHKLRTLRNTAVGNIERMSRVSSQNIEHIQQMSGTDDCVVKKECSEDTSNTVVSSRDGDPRRSGQVKDLPNGLLEQTHRLVNLEMERLLCNYVNHHCDIIRFMRSFEAFFDLLFGLTLISNLTITVLILATPNVGSDTSVAAIHGPRILSFLIQLWLFCYLANKASQESFNVVEAISACDWLESSDSFKKSMRVVISMANQPIVIKTFGFVPMAMVTVSSVINTAYSYYTVLSGFSK